MPKINQLSPASSLAESDIMIADTSMGSNTRKITYSSLKAQLQNDSKSVFALKGETATDEQVASAVTEWLDENVDPTGSAVVVDDSLSIASAAADAKATGDGLVAIKGALPSIAHEFYTVISNGTDYNTITTPGTYVVASAANAQSMLNCPSSYAHKMYVVTTVSAARVCQFIFDATYVNDCYKRYSGDGGTTWGAWKKIAIIDDIPDDHEQVTANTTDIANIKASLPSISIVSGTYTTISVNTDYNNITTPGTYICLSSSDAGTMSHCPVSVAHKLFVIAVSNIDRLCQIVIANDLNMVVYKRYYLYSWGEWKKEAYTSDVPTSQVNTNTTDIANIKSSLPSISTVSGTWSTIQNGTNYNNLTTPGTFICLSASSAQTMINCPTNWAHKMFVVAVSNIDRLCQIVIANDISMAVYKRYYYNSWGAWKKEATEYQGHKLLVIGDSYSQQERWLNQLSTYIKIDSLVNLGVTSASVKDKYTNRSTYPYTSRPTKNDNMGNHNTFMCQIEKLKRLMEGTDLDEGEAQIYTSADDYPNIIIIEGGQNDQPDSTAAVDTYANQFMKQVSNVYVADNSEQTPTLGTAYIKLPSDECDRTCFAGAYRSIVEELQTLFPKAQIFATSRTILGYWNAERFPSVTNIRQQQELVCNMVGINFINWQAGTQINLMNNYPKGSGTQNDPYCRAEVAGTLSSHDTYDLLHPFTLGAKKYAKVVANAINQNFLEMELM